MNEYDCLEACKSRPLLQLVPGVPSAIRDILLSRIAVGPNVTFGQVAKAIDELINLNYPVINRILEVSAYFCALGRLYIYCANPSEFESLKLSGETHGYFNKSNGLIVVSTRLPLSQLLIHELTHAVRFFITINEDRPGVSRHQDFCKRTFPTLFSQALKNKQPTREEQEELDSIELRAKALQQLVVEHARNCSVTEWEKMMDRSRTGSSIFQVSRQKIYDQQRLRRELYESFKLYEMSDCAEEFLSFFLQRFVNAAYHQRITSLQSWVANYMNVTAEYADKVYEAKLLGMMCSSLPSSIVETFVKGDFRTALDNYVESIKPFFKSKDIAELKDSDYYCLSLAEPLRIQQASWKR